MRKIIFSFLILILSVTTQAQDGNFNDGQLNQITESLSSNYILAAQSRDIIGDPYLNIDWVGGVVHISKGVNTDKLMLRFNTERNIVEFKRGDGILGIKPSKIDGFTLYGYPSDLEFKNGFKSDEHDINRSQLLRIIYDGKVKLVAHHSTKLKKDIASYGSASQKDEYVDSVNYYIIDENGDFKETKLKQRDILKDLKRIKRKQIESYAKENNLDFEKEKDLVRILKQYDNLEI